MSKPKDPVTFLNHVYEAIQDIKKYKETLLDLKDLEDKQMIQDAIIRKLEIIGEAVGNISSEFIASHPEVNWRGPKNLRNVLSHQYFEVNLKAVWEVINDDLLVLEKEIKPLLEDI